VDIDEILKDEGWTVECESPFEVRNRDGSFASGQGASYVVEGLREERTVYRFITYGAKLFDSASGAYHYWNQVIDISPMKFINNIIDAEINGENNWHSFQVINACEITQKEFKEYKDKF